MSAWREASGTTKVLIFFTVVFFVSLGLCGLSVRSAVDGGGSGEAAIAGLLGMFGSLAGMVITLVVSFIANAIANRGGHPQKLFDDRDEK
ncbi:MAG TPA: hypothetical protein VGJ21_18450 [Terracidiphilus sp.]|jgi:hypothetical protein